MNQAVGRRWKIEFIHGGEYVCIDNCQQQEQLNELVPEALDMNLHITVGCQWNSLSSFPSTHRLLEESIEMAITMVKVLVNLTGSDEM